VLTLSTGEPSELLVREYNTSSGACILTSSLSLASAAKGPFSWARAPTLVQVSHELEQPSGALGGVQMWRMQPLRDGQDEEAFTYSGSEL